MATRRTAPTPTGGLATAMPTGGLGDLTGWKTKTVPLDEFWKGNYADFSHLIGGEGYVPGSVGAINNMQGVYDAYASGGNMADALTKDNRYGNGIQYDPATRQVTYKYDDSGTSFGGSLMEFATSPGVLMALGAGAPMLAGAGVMGAGAAGSFGGLAGAGEIPALYGATEGLAAGGLTGGAAGVGGGLGGVAGAAEGAGAWTAAEEAAMLTGSGVATPGVGAFPAATLPTLPNMPRDGGETAADLAQYGNAGDIVPNVPKGVQPGMWSRVISGSGTIDDFAKIFGGIAPAVMGWFASNKNTEALEKFTNQWMSMGQGYRDQLANLYTQGGMDAWANSPQVQTTLNKTLEGAARTLSTEGNPALNPFAQNTMRDAGLDAMWGMLTGEKQFLAGAGGLGSFNSAAPQMALAQVNSGNNAWNAIGSGLSSVLNPQPTLEELFAMMQRYGINSTPNRATNIGTIG